MVPVGIPASTFDDPSSGSKTTTYFSVSSRIISLDLVEAFPIRSTFRLNQFMRDQLFFSQNG